MRSRLYNEDAGSALLAVVVFMFIVSMFATAFVTLVNTSVTASNRSTHRQVCLALAEGGIEKAGISLRADPVYRGEPYFALGDGEVKIQVEIAELADHYTVTSTVRYSAMDSAQVSITADLVVSASGARIVRWEERGR